MRPGFPDQLGESEAVVAGLVEGAHLDVPRFLGLERVNGRLGLRYERLDGPTMLDRLTSRPWLGFELAGRFAAIHATMHGTGGAGLPPHRATFQRSLRRASARVDPAVVNAALRRLESLADGSMVCHGDMHPGNVILAARGPVVIDWETARAGPPEADIARTLLLLDGALPDGTPRLQRALLVLFQRRFIGHYLARYRRIRPIDDRQLGLWRLPILVARLGEGIVEEQASLTRAINAELRRPAEGRVRGSGSG